MGGRLGREDRGHGHHHGHPAPHGGPEPPLLEDAAHLAVAVAASLKVGEFNFSRLAEFLTKKLAPYVLVYAAAMILGEAAGLVALAPLALTAIELALWGDLVDNLVKLGLKLPGTIKRFIVK